MGSTCCSTEERSAAVTFKGNPLTLRGPKITVGQQAPEFQVLAQDLSPVTFSSAKGKVVLLSVTPSLDTPVCDAQARRLNEEATKLKGVEVWNISMDLPFAQKRWCAAAGVQNVRVLSDHKEASFGKAFGTLIKELRLLTRSMFVIDRDGTVQYVEYVPEVTSHPNYEAAVAAVTQLVK